MIKVICQVFVVCCIVVIGLLIIRYVPNKVKQQDTAIDTVEVLKYKNDSLIIKVNNIDSIRNVEVVNVKNLDNDSTVKLFYKLVKSK